MLFKDRFLLQPCRSVTNDMDTIEYAMFRYDTVKVENWLNSTSWSMNKIKAF